MVKVEQRNGGQVSLRLQSYLIAQFNNRMWYKKIRLISLFVALSAAISCTNSNSFVRKSQVQDPFDNTFNQGKTYIKLEELKSTKGAPKTLLDHPQYLKKGHAGKCALVHLF